MPHLNQSSEVQNQKPERRYPERSNRGRSNAIYGYHIKTKKFINVFGKKGEEAISLELTNMIKKDVFSPVLHETLSAQDKKNIIPSFIFLKEKFKPSDESDKVKARLVAGGNHQDKTLFPNISSPTADINHIFIEGTLAATRKDQTASADIGAAYLNAEMKDIVYMILDKRTTKLLVKMYPEFEKFINESGKMVVKLNKALYGCVQSALLWYECLRDFLLKIGFTTNPYDECIFTRNNRTGNCTIIVYVDDLLFMASSKNIIEEVIDHLRTKFEDINVTYGKVLSYLRMELSFDHGVFKVTMKGYIEKLIKENNVTEFAQTPASNDLFNITNEEQLSDKDQKATHSLVAQLLYLSVRVRPDILLPVNFLSTRVNKFTEGDGIKLSRVLKYLNYTKDLGLSLKCANPEEIEIITAADASYGCHVDGKGQTGILTSLGAGAVNSSTTKQKLVAKSSSEAELIASSDGISHLVNVKNYLSSRGFKIKNLKLLQDNVSTQHIIKNGIKSAKRMRHLNIRYFFMKQCVDDNNIEVKHVSTSDMIADLFTKPIQGERFNLLRDKVLGTTPMCEAED